MLRTCQQENGAISSLILFYIKDIIRLIVDIVRDLKTLVIEHRKFISNRQQQSNIVKTVIAFHPFRNSIG